MKTLIKYLYRSRIKSGMTIAFIVLLSLSFFWPVWLNGKLPIPADALVGLYHPFRDYYAVNFPNGVPFKNYILTDPVLQQYPWKWLVINGWKDNPYNFSGTPLSANIQAGVFYPLNLIFIFINNFPLAWMIFIVIQPILASLFMFWWLKNNGIKQIAAIFGGLIWAFSSFNLVWLEWGNIGHAGLWLPLALLAVDRIFKKKKDIVIPAKAGIYLNRFRVKPGMITLFWHAILQFALASSLFAGHFQIMLYLFIAVALYIIILKRPGLATARPGLNKFSVFFVHCFLFLVITSPQWFPTLKLTLQSNRSVEQADVLTREGFFIRPRQLVQLIAPDFFGNPSTLNYRGSWNYAEQIIYIGMIPIIFSILAIFHFVIPGSSTVLSSLSKDLTRNLFKYLYRSRIKSGMTVETIELFSLILISSGLLFAVDNPISRLPYQLKLPIISDLQPTRLAYLITFGLSALSAIGFNEFIKRPRKLLSKIMTILPTFAILLFALLVISSKFSPDAKLISQRNLIFPFITLGMGILIGSALWIVPKKTYSLLLTLYFLFSIIDLFRFGWKFTPFSPKKYLYPITPAIKFLQNNMRENDRYMTLDRRILPPNANIMYKLKSIEGYDPIYSKNYALLITEMESGFATDKPQSFGRIVKPTNFKSPVTAILGVRYVLSLSDLEEKGWVKVFQEGETRIYERR